MDVIKETEKQMQSAVEHLKAELKGIRTGRANPAILEGVQVDVYGTKMRITDVATISAPEPRQLLISPFDMQNVHSIAKGIEEANLNLQPIKDGNVVRVNIPEMDAKVRQDMVKVAKRKCEETKVSIRNARREANDLVKKQKNDGDIAEDVMKKLEKSIQEKTDSFCKQADELATSKEKEILTI
jgi:ribosome recycling factor